MPRRTTQRAEALRHAAHLERGRVTRAREASVTGSGAHAPLERAMSRSNCTFSAIAKMITTPTHTKNSFVLTPMSVSPAWRMPIRIAPMKAPMTVPRPPVSAVPPITQAPTA